MSDQVVASPAWRAVARPAIIIAVLVVLIVIAQRIPMTIEMFIIATLIAYGINPIIRFLHRKLPRLAAIVIVYVIFFILLVLAVAIIIPTIIGQLQTLFANSGDYLTAIQNFINSRAAALDKLFGRHMLPSQFSSFEDAALAQASNVLQAGLSRVGGFVVSVASAFVIGFSAIVLSYYLLVNAFSIQQSFLDLFPHQAEGKARRFITEVQRIFGGFIGGQILLCLFCGVFTFVGLVVLRSPYALLIGVLTGLLYAIPYIGVAVAIVIGGLLGLLQSWQVAVWTVVIIFLVTRVSDTLLVPKVMAESVGVSPMAVIFAVFAGGELFGLWGLVLAIPAAAIFKAIWVVWLYPWLTGREAPPSDTTPPVLLQVEARRE